MKAGLLAVGQGGRKGYTNKSVNTKPTILYNKHTPITDVFWEAEAGGLP